MDTCLQGSHHLRQEASRGGAEAAKGEPRHPPTHTTHAPWGTFLLQMPHVAIQLKSVEDPATGASSPLSASQHRESDTVVSLLLSQQITTSLVV